jgi:hypothetical protein
MALMLMVLFFMPVDQSYVEAIFKVQLQVSAGRWFKDWLQIQVRPMRRVEMTT